MSPQSRSIHQMFVIFLPSRPRRPRPAAPAVPSPVYDRGNHVCNFTARGLRVRKIKSADDRLAIERQPPSMAFYGGFGSAQTQVPPGPQPLRSEWIPSFSLARSTVR